MKQLKIDWNNLIDAFSSEHDDYRCFLNTETGDISWRSLEIVERERKEGTNSPPHIVEVPHISAREGWELMMDFVGQMLNKQLKTKLLTSIQGKGAFRRFKEVLTQFPQDQERWFVYQDAAHTKILDQWLLTIDIESTNTPTYDVKVGDRVALEKPPIDADLLDTVLLAADHLVGKEPLTYLAQILKGSKAKAIKEKNGEAIPGYGVLQKMTIKEIEGLLDKLVSTKWLDVEQSGPEEKKDPLLVHSRKGWDRIRDLWANLLLQKMETAQDAESIAEFMNVIRARHRDIRQHFLDLLFKKAEKKHLPILDAWKNEEVRKFKKRIIGLIRRISGEGRPTHSGQRNRPDRHRQPSHAKN